MEVKQILIWSFFNPKLKIISKILFVKCLPRLFQKLNVTLKISFYVKSATMPQKISEIKTAKTEQMISAKQKFWISSHKLGGWVVSC